MKASGLKWTRIMAQKWDRQDSHNTAFVLKQNFTYVLAYYESKKH
jgi:hypothetical protein